MMAANKKPAPLPVEVADYPYQKLAMDIGETPMKEHFLVIVDRYSGYIWTAKTGNRNSGTAAEIRNWITNGGSNQK